MRLSDFTKVVATLTIVLALVSVAWSDTFTFTSTHGKAVITTSTTGMTVELTDLFNPVNEIVDVLDGIVIALSTAPSGTSLTGLSNPSGFVTCSGSGGGTSCSSITTTDPDPGVPNAPLYGWTASQTSATTVDLEAGAGSFKPYGIVNSTIQGADGLGNSQHVPYLVGPVTFTVTWGTTLDSAPSVANATFEFGTVPATEAGAAVPEPATLALLGSGLLGLGALSRKRRRASRAA